MFPPTCYSKVGAELNPMKRITAKFEGTCTGCNGPIHRGMDIYWKKGIGAYHLSCWDKYDDGEVNAAYIENAHRYYQESEITIPTFLQAREKYQGYQVRFYESLAVPEQFLEAILDERLSRNELEDYTQWRLDFPLGFNSPVEEEIQRVILVAHKILTRGRITLESPFLERKFKEYFRVTDVNVEQFRHQNYLSTCNYSKETNFWVDSPLEKKFLEEILFKELGSYYRHFVIPQVHISSLVPEVEGHDSYGDQRVDFLITTKDKKIVVELDDPDHVGHEDRDRSRDELLTRWSYEVLRIRNDELESGDGLNLQDLRELLQQTKKVKVEDLSVTDKYAVAIKLAHQLQIVTVEALLSGALNFNNCNNVYLDIDLAGLSGDDVLYILNESIIDLCNFLKKLAKLYKCNLNGETLLNTTIYEDSCKAPGIVISYGESVSSSLPCFFLQDITFPSQISQFGRPVNPSRIEGASKEDLEFFLKYLFRKEQFWEGQYEAISRTLAGQDTVVLLPTGGGKSMAFQLASMLLPGVALVIDPIVSLIDDQIDNLQRMGIDRAIGITAQIEDPNTKSRIIKAFGQGEYLFCYVAPERLQTEEFRGSLRSLTLSTPVSLIAIDEAHCVSEWGHDFRPSYLNIGKTSREHCTSHNRTPPLLALTGTASHAVLKDVRRELQIEEFDSIITPKTFDRQELRYCVYESPSDQKKNQLQTLLLRTLPSKFGTASVSFYRPRGNRTFSGLVFCPFVDGDFGVVKNTQELERAGIHANFYCGSAPRGPGLWRDRASWNQYKRETAKSFKNNKCPLMVATKAFAMGIDKPNIRFTIHFGIPPSIEAFYQEAGRAGRDRNKAECVLLFSIFDKERAERLLQPNMPIENILQERKTARRNGTDDDVTRALFFHNFEGIEVELSFIDVVIQKLGNLRERRKVRIKFDDKKDRVIWEKVLQRLLVLGIVEDYTLDYSSDEFTILVRGIDKDTIIHRYELYVSGYNKGRVKEESRKLQEHVDNPYYNFVRQACHILVHFIYETIEKGRRRALREMFLLADSAVNKDNCDEIVRERILRYLESSRAEEIEAILNEKNEFNKLKLAIQGKELPEGEMIGGIKSPRDAADMRGQAGRYLESVPDHPGLLFLRAVSEAYCSDFKLSVVAENLLDGVRFAFSQYLVDKQVVYEVLSWLLLDIYDKKTGISLELIEELVFGIDDPLFARLIVCDEDFSADMLYAPSLYLLNNLASRAIKTLQTE